MVLYMNEKKVSLLLLSIVFISLFSGIVSAQGSDGVGAGIGEAFDVIREMFAFLPDLITLEALLGEETVAIFWAKFLVWILLFAIVYFGASIPFKDNKRVAMVIALAISLMGAILMPNDMLANIFQTYGLLAGILIWVAPVAAGMFIAAKVTERFTKALIYGTGAWILWSINATVIQKAGFANTSFPYFSILFAVMVILFIWNVVGIFIGGEGQARWAGNIGRGLGDFFGRNRDDDRGILDRFRNRDPHDRGDPNDRREQNQRLVDLNNRLADAQQHLNEEIRGQQGHELEDLIAIANLINRLIVIEREMRDIARPQPQQGGGG